MPRGGVEVQRYSFFNLGARWGVGDQSHAPAALPPGERPDTHCIRGWVGPRAGLDRCGKSRPHRIRPPDRQARSESLYRLHHPGTHLQHVPASKLFDHA